MGRRGKSHKDVGRSQRNTFSWSFNGKNSKSCKNNGKADNIILIDIDNDDNISNVVTFNVAESLKQKLPGLTVLGNDKRCPIPIIVYIHDEDEISDKNQPATSVEGSAGFSSDASSRSRSLPSPDQTRISTGGDDDDKHQVLHEILSLLKLSKYKRAYCAKAPSRSHYGFGSELSGDPCDNKLKEKANKHKKDGSEEKVEDEKENKTGKYSKDEVHDLYPDFHDEAPFSTSDMKSTEETKSKQTASNQRDAEVDNCINNSCKSFSGDKENLVFEEPLFESKSKGETQVSDDFAGKGFKAGAEYVKVNFKEKSKSNFVGVEKSRCIPDFHNKSATNLDIKSIHETKGKQTARWVKISHNGATLGKDTLVYEEPLFQNSKSTGETETRVSDDLERNNIEASSGKCVGKDPPWGMPDLKEREEQCREKAEQVPREPFSGNKFSCNEAETELDGVAQQDKDETGGEFVKCCQSTTSSGKKRVELKKGKRADKISNDGVQKMGHKKSHFAGGEKTRFNPAFHNKSPIGNSDLKSTRGTKGKQTARWVRVSKDKETPGPDFSHNEATSGATFESNNANDVPEEPSSRNSGSTGETRVDDDLSGNDVAGGDMETDPDCLINIREKHKETDEYKRAEEEEWASRQHALRLQAKEAQKMRQELKRMKAEVENGTSAGDDVDNVQDCLINIRERYKETDEYKRAEEEERASRQHALRLQAEEARKMRQVLKRMKAEKLRKLDMERRQKQRIEEIRETQKKNEENMNMKEKLRAEVRMELEQLEAQSLDMGSLLRGLGVPVSGGLEPQPQEIRGAYKKALLSFHPDRAPASDIRKLVEAEEKFKLISRLKDKLSSTS